MSRLRAAIIPVTPFQQNCALIWDEQSKLGAFVDPGGEANVLLDAASQHGVRIEKILLTHGHLDHAGAAADLAERLNVPIEGPHRDEADLLAAIPKQAELYGFPDARACTPNRWLDDGDAVRVGEVAFQVIHCPGHTKGHVVFYQPEARFAFVGDVLFQGSIGRTDFPGGNFDDLISSIRSKLFPLGDDVAFLPGHGPTSTFAEERRSNPFVSDAAVAAR